MAESSEVPEELRKLVGMSLEPYILEVERGAIRRFAEAVGNPNPLHWDVDYAGKTSHGDLICPPGFFGWRVKAGALPLATSVTEVMDKITQVTGLSRVLDGGIEYEFMTPIRAGDTLTAIPKVADISLRETKTGKMFFLLAETRFINQNSTPVARSLATTIIR
jgi:acyl dehydratase